MQLQVGNAGTVISNSFSILERIVVCATIPAHDASAPAMVPFSILERIVVCATDNAAVLGSVPTAFSILERIVVCATRVGDSPRLVLLPFSILERIVVCATHCAGPGTNSRELSVSSNGSWCVPGRRAFDAFSILERIVVCATAVLVLT